MLADVLEKVVTASTSGCAVRRWLDTQDSRVESVFELAVKAGTVPNYQEFYNAIKNDALSKNENPPFVITTLKNHIQSRCACLKIRG